MSPVGATGFPLSRLLAGWADVPAACEGEVKGLCHDSRSIQPGDLFIALAGSRSHGMRHARQAQAQGACAIVYDPAHGGAELAESELSVPLIPLAGLNHVLGHIADRFYGEPSGSLGVIGITGTNGKTSCSHFLAHALVEDAPSAVIGTLGWGVPGALQATAHTTPDAIEIHSLLAKLAVSGIASVMVEASSHGLDQGRLNGVRFEGGLFTNLSRDHLDYHKDMESYLEAKLRLVAWPGLRYLAFNLDDESAGAIMAKAPKRLRKIGFTLAETPPSIEGVEIVNAKDICHEQEGISFDVQFDGSKGRVFAPLYGDFNVENLLGSLAVLLAKGFELETACQRLRRVHPVPGRMERFAVEGKTAVVDYAHTPDALKKTLASVRRHCRGSLWAVFGCGGDRDRGKRPQMGAIAEKLADRVVLTDDNPRSEQGEAIIQEILAGCERRDITVIADRRQAIAHALKQSGPDDVVLVAGKGHENTQEIAGVKYPFSDREVVREWLGLEKGGMSLCA